MVEENQNNVQPWDMFKAEHTPISLEGHWQPFYDDRRDYNTNAPTYFDYLANMNQIPKAVADATNEIAKRNIDPETSDSIELYKIHDWIKDDPANYVHKNPVIKLRGNVILSPKGWDVFVNGSKQNFDNAIISFHGAKGGLWAPDYLPLIERNITNIDMLSKNHTEYVAYVDEKIVEFSNKINEMSQTVNEVKAENQRLRSAVQKFVDNMNFNGNATTNNIEDFEIVDGIACGNINVWGGQAGGGSLIRTHKDVRENDITVGHI